MKTFEYTIDGHRLTIRLDEKHATVAEILADGRSPHVSETEMPQYAAVIALALLDYEVEVVHDDEAGIITLEAGKSQWSSPSLNLRPELAAK